MKAFSELTSASQVNNADILAISQENSGSYASKKTTVKDVTDLANLNIAEEYDSTSSYAADDYCIYESVLYKCTASTTGTFDPTKWTAVVVTDEMGSGGGGTGGHTIIDENGNSMTARAGLQFVGGANVSDDNTNNKTIVDLASAGGIDGVFIDTDNVIKSSTAFRSSMSYTATEDCFVNFYIVVTANTSTSISINGVNIAGFWHSNLNGGDPFGVYLKKGQTISVSGANSSSDSSYTVYGIQTGTTHSKFQPVIYSTEEREIGVWTDGKPLYEKTLELSSIPSTSPISIDVSALNIDVMASAVGEVYAISNGAIVETVVLPAYISSSYYGAIRFLNDNVQILHRGLNDYQSGKIVIQYTKTTDTAGSGIWTPQGVPTVHYSTDEHIVGTWIDGKTIYEKTIDKHTSPVAVNSNTWTTFDTFSTDIKIINAMALSVFNGDIESSYCVNAFYENGEIKILQTRNTSISIGYLTIQYTKSS